MNFAFAVLAGDIGINPAAEVRKLRGLPFSKREALTEEQEAAVKASLDAPPDLFLYFLLYTGLRRGDAMALACAGIDWKRSVIHINKKISYSTYPVRLENWTKSGNGIRDVPPLPPLAAALPRNHIGLIFPGKSGYMSEYEVKTKWREYCRTVGFVETLFRIPGKPWRISLNYREDLHSSAEKRAGSRRREPCRLP